MTSMTKNERAAHYLKRIKSAPNPLIEARAILEELNSLIWTSTGQKLSRQEKLEIVKEIESLAFPTTRRWEPATEASDNSGILDVITMLKKGAKD